MQFPEKQQEFLNKSHQYQWPRLASPHCNQTRSTDIQRSFQRSKDLCRQALISLVMRVCLGVVLATGILSAQEASQPATSSKETLPTPSQEKLKTFRTMFTYSDTVYLDTKVLQNALMKRFEIHAWKISLSGRDSADVWIKVARPVFTFDWRYSMTDPATGQELGAGRIVAWDGKRAADALAADIARAIGRVRPLPLYLLVALGEEPNARKWELEYQGGSEGPRKGVRLTVSVSPERIVGWRESRALFMVPAQSVSGIGYNARSTDAAKGWETFWESMFSSVGDDPNSAVGALALVPIALGGEAILKQIKSTEHLCDISWIDNGEVRNIVLKADNSGTAREFVAAIEKASHRKAIDMEAEATTLLEAIEHENQEGHFIPLQIDKMTAVGWKILRPGAYRVVVVEREPSRGVAYFLAPDAGATPVERNTIVAQMPVEIEPFVPEENQPNARYREANGVTFIEEIITADKILKLRAIPLKFATEPQVREDMEALLAEAALKPKYRSIFVKSDTVYLKHEVMEQALADHPALIEWEFQVIPNVQDAELELVLTRPFLTFEWTYTVTVVKTGEKLAEGKITARDGGRAAMLIADQIVNALKAKAALGIHEIPK